MSIKPSKRSANFDYAIRHVVRAAEKLEREGRTITYLNIGDPQAFGHRPPDFLIEAVNRALKNEFTGYSHSAGLKPARRAVADYATKLGAPTDINDVMITAGASEAADLLLSAMLDADDEVLIPAPGYPIYPAIINKLGARAIYYTLDAAKGWQLDTDEIESLITSKTRALILINPNNPTGSITPDATTLKLLNLAEAHNLLIISDEVYRELCYVTAPRSASVLAQNMSVPVVTLESLSKTHNVPGWRVGWMRFTNSDLMRDLIAAVMKLAGGRLCSPTPAQYAVAPALETASSFVHDLTATMRRRRDFIVEKIARIEGLTCVEPQAAFYLMLQVRNLNQRTDEQFVLDLLHATNILTVHGSGFGANPEHGFFRLVFLADEHILADALMRIEKFINQEKT